VPGRASEAPGVVIPRRTGRYTLPQIGFARSASSFGARVPLGRGTRGGRPARPGPVRSGPVRRRLGRVHI